MDYAGTNKSSRTDTSRLEAMVGKRGRRQRNEACSVPRHTAFTSGGWAIKSAAHDAWSFASGWREACEVRVLRGG